jgi:hypothetical protein
MEPENFSSENADAVIVTRWILAIGLGGIMLFISLSFLWLSLFGPSSSIEIGPNLISSPTPAVSNIGVAEVTPNQTATTSALVLILEPTPTFGVATLTLTKFVATNTPTPYPTATPYFYLSSTSTPSESTATVTLTLNPTPTTAITLYPDATSTPLESTTTLTVASELLATSTPSIQSLAEPLVAAQAFDQLQALHFIIEIRSGKVEILPGTQLKRAEGDLSRANQFEAKILAHTLLGDVTVQTIRVGSDQFLTNPIGGKWAKLGAGQSFDLEVLFDHQNGVSGLLSQLQDVSFLSDEIINGVTCQHFVGTLAGNKVGPVTYGTLGHNPVTLEVWVGRSDQLIRQLYLKEINSGGAFWAINFSQFNETVNIQKPL